MGSSFSSESNFECENKDLYNGWDGTNYVIKENDSQSCAIYKTEANNVLDRMTGEPDCDFPNVVGPAIDTWMLNEFIELVSKNCGDCNESENK
jgi:hypothetical protein